MRRKLNKLFTLASLSAVTVLGLGHIYKKTSSFVVDSALNRDIPPLLKGKRNPNSNVVPEGMKNDVKKLSDNLKNSADERIEIISRGGEKLVGHWKRSSDSRRIVIAFHGWRSAWNNDFCGVSKFFEDEKCDVLYVEQRAHGQSDGEYMGFGLTERFDCLDWIDYADSNNPYNLPIYLVGISMGATTVLMASGFSLCQNVKGIIADSGFTSPYEIWAHVAKTNFRLPFSFFKKSIDKICKERINFAPDDYSTLDAMEKCSVPVLFIHGEKDTFVPIEMTYENYEKCKSEKVLFVIPDATHALGYVYDKEGYEKVLKDFFQKYDN